MAGDASTLAPSSARPPAGLVAQYGGAQGAGRRGEMTSATEPRRAVPPIRETLPGLRGGRELRPPALVGWCRSEAPRSRLPLFSQILRMRYSGPPARHHGWPSARKALACLGPPGERPASLLHLVVGAQPGPPNPPDASCSL